MERVTTKIAEDPNTNLSDRNIAFQNDVSILSDSTIDLFNQIKACDIDIRENHPRVLEIGNLIKTKIDDLCAKHLVVEVEAERRMEDLRVEVEKLKEHKEEGVVGDE